MTCLIHGPKEKNCLDNKRGAQLGQKRLPARGERPEPGWRVGCFILSWDKLGTRIACRTLWQAKRKWLLPKLWPRTQLPYQTESIYITALTRERYLESDGSRHTAKGRRCLMPGPFPYIHSSCFPQKRAHVLSLRKVPFPHNMAKFTFASLKKQQSFLTRQTPDQQEGMDSPMISS